MHQEVLKSKQKEIFKKLKNFSDFYLAGGTALALQIGHRISVASIKEIALMKAFTLGRRAALKDYVDLYIILKNKLMGLNDILNSCEKKYKREFNGRLFLEELTYLEDVREVRKGAQIEFLIKPMTRSRIKEFFEQEIKKIKL